MALTPTDQVAWLSNYISRQVIKGNLIYNTNAFIYNYSFSRWFSPYSATFQLSTWIAQQYSIRVSAEE